MPSKEVTEKVNRRAAQGLGGCDETVAPQLYYSSFNSSDSTRGDSGSLLLRQLECCSENGCVLVSDAYVPSPEELSGYSLVKNA